MDCYSDTSKTENVKKMLEEAERTHATKLTVLEQKLQEETEKRFDACQCADTQIKGVWVVGHLSSLSCTCI